MSARPSECRSAISFGGTRAVAREIYAMHVAPHVNLHFLNTLSFLHLSRFFLRSHFLILISLSQGMMTVPG